MTKRLLVTYLTITAFALVALAVPLGVTFGRRERDRLYFDIERDAFAIASLVEDDLEAGGRPAVDDVLAAYRDRTRGRIVVVDRAGRTVADSERPDDLDRDYSTRPEIATALDGGRAVGERGSETLGGGIVFVAIPVSSGTTLHGAVRITFPTDALDERIRNAWLRLGALSVLVLGAVAGVGFVLARSVSRPVRDLEAAAERIAAGDLVTRVPTDRGTSELRALAGTFNRTAERLTEVLGEQRRFVADAAHQLRSPLTALRLRLENLQDGASSDDRPAVDAAINEVARLSRIVDGLLVLARSDASGPMLESLDVAEAARGRVDAWHDAAAEQGVTLAIDAPAELWALATPDAVEQILDNLVSNALDAAPASTTVVVRVEQNGDEVAIHVVDEGPGLDPTEREQAFNRFWRGRRDTAGTGLGLAIVRRLAEAAGGSARLDEGPGGRGLDAVVCLPRPSARQL
jgi:signal transduction histidine kinase